MKIGIITHYDVHNHGAILQLNALTKVLKERYGKEAKALRFDKNYDFMGRALKAKYEISIKSVGIYAKFLREKGIKNVIYNYNKRKTLEKFKAENNLIGDYYSESKELEAVVIGSDEVFALHTGPTPVFFGHALPSNKVFSYAGSFGPTTYEDIESKHCEAFIASGLKAMKGVSVRDKNSFALVQRLTGITPTLVCDPVILYGYHQEIETATAKHSLPPFLLIYAYDNRMNDEEEVRQIKAYAKSNGLKTASVGFYHSWCDYNINASPTELFAYFKQAKGVLTDTFHGSVISIVTNSRFVVKTRDNGNKLCNLLDEYGLTSRIIPSFDKIGEVMDKELDFAAVNEQVEHRRAASLQFLDSMLK